MTIPMLSIALAGAVPAVKDMGAAWRAFMGIPAGSEGVPTSLRDFGRQPADEAWVSVCVGIRIDAAQSVPLRVQVKDGKRWVDWEQADRPDPAADALQWLLDDVNPEWQGAQLKAYLEAGFAVHGGSYLRKVRGRLGGPPQELFWISGAELEPVRGRTLVEGYRYTTTGEVTPAREIIPFRGVNLQDPVTLLSPLSAARYEISVSKRAAQWNDSLLANWSIPPAAWIADKDVELTPQDANFIKRAMRSLRGPQQQGKVPILPGGLKYQPLALTEKDADWLSTRKVSRMTVAAVLGVPLVLAGDDEKASVYASMRDAERVFWRKKMIPSLDWTATTFNAWLVPDFDRTRKRLRVAYDYGGIEALRPPIAEDMAAWLQAVDRGLPLNRFVDRFSMGEPIDGGDEARLPEPGPRLNNDGSRPMPRSEAQLMPNDVGRETIRSLGKHLYKDPAVRAYLEGAGEDVLAALVPAEVIPTLVVGLDRRYSASQILDGVPSEGYRGLP